MPVSWFVIWTGSVGRTLTKPVALVNRYMALQLRCVLLPVRLAGNEVIGNYLKEASEVY